MAKSKPIILIDSREQKPYTFRGLETVTSGMIVGDYCVLGKEHYIIERKASPLELHGNFTKGRERFYNELNRAVEGDISLLILLEFSLADLHKKTRYARINAQMIVNTLTSINQKYGFPYVFAGNRTQAQWFANKFFNYV